MNSLESPLEALALNYLSYGFLTAVNNVWAWIAVVTAAISFWRIKALSSPPVPRCLSQEGASTSSSQQTKNLAAEPPTASSPVGLASPIAKTTAAYRVLERQGSTKMRFTAYYNEDDSMEEEDEGSCAAVGGGRNRFGMVSENIGGWWCDDWERTMAVRMGDMGWYNCQDLTVLDGSVVRLWEGHRHRSHTAALVAGGAPATW